MFSADVTGPLPASVDMADDCDVGKTGKKACKNCSCGRAEMEEQGVKVTADMLDNPQSACGNVGGCFWGVLPWNLNPCLAKSLKLVNLWPCIPFFSCPDAPPPLSRAVLPRGCLPLLGLPVQGTAGV